MGEPTVGCCAHIASVLWYLRYHYKYMENISQYYSDLEYGRDSFLIRNRWIAKWGIKHKNTFKIQNIDFRINITPSFRLSCNRIEFN